MRSEMGSEQQQTRSLPLVEAGIRQQLVKTSDTTDMILVACSKATGIQVWATRQTNTT